ncbi:MAG: hypothetical protein ACOC7J_02075, partial [Armatimonadota bacterium]
MHRATVICLLLTIGSLAAADLTLDERLDILWERAVRQSDFARFDDAIATGRRAVAIAPERADAWALLAYTHWLHPDGLEHLAQGQVQRALGIDPDCARARMVSGLLTPWVTDPPDYRLAVAELERATALDATLPRAWSMLGLARLDAREPRRALPALRNAVELGRQYYEWPMNLAEGLTALGRRKEAVEAARRAAELTFSDFSEQLARNNLAWHICMLLPDDPARRGEALQSARRAVHLLPDDPVNLDTLGTAEFLFGDPTRASE